MNGNHVSRPQGHKVVALCPEGVVFGVLGRIAVSGRRSSLAGSIAAVRGLNWAGRHHIPYPKLVIQDKEDVNSAFGGRRGSTRMGLGRSRGGGSSGCWGVGAGR
jgi:hypothetical protein